MNIERLQAAYLDGKCRAKRGKQFAEGCAAVYRLALIHAKQKVRIALREQGANSACMVEVEVCKAIDSLLENS